MPKMSCSLQGRLTVGPRQPAGNYLVTIGPGGLLMGAIQSLARLAYDNRTWLVPGMPEAASHAEAMAALQQFRERVTKHIDREVAERKAAR